MHRAAEHQTFKTAALVDDNSGVMAAQGDGAGRQRRLGADGELVSTRQTAFDPADRGSGTQLPQAVGQRQVGGCPLTTCIGGDRGQRCACAIEIDPNAGTGRTGAR